MRRTTAILAAVLMIPLLVAGVPEAAGAQTFKLRLWSTPTSASLPGGEPNGPERVRPQNYLDSLAPGNIVWDSTLLGFEFRSRPVNRFIWSLAYDTGGVNNLVDTEGGFGASPGTNRFFSTNLHYLIAPANWRGAEMTVFAGYGSGFLGVSTGGGPREFSASGLRYGLDLYVPFREAWYLSGSAAFGSWSINHSLGGVLDPPGGTASIRDYNLALGRLLSPEAGLEVGYRSTQWSTTAVGSTPCPCTMAWDGWYAAITVRRR